jgi:transcriptional regulator with XRE-family HTH domain
MTMTMMEATRPRSEDRPAVIPRPASGIRLEPGRLNEWMAIRALSRHKLSNRIAEMRLLPLKHAVRPADRHAAEPDDDDWHRCTACGGALRSGLSADGIAKIANGFRRPKAETLQALAAALYCRHEQLLPGSTPPDPDTEARRRVISYNEGMREFADALGRPELYLRPTPDGGTRIRPTAELRRLYAEWLSSPEHQQEMALLAS